MSKLQMARYTAAPGDLPIAMAQSEGTAMRLLKHGRFGADLIRFAPGKRVGAHIHPGDHILVVVSGSGWLEYGGKRFALKEGVLYLVPGHVPHSIGAHDEDLTLLSVANDHREPDANDRLEVIP